MFRSRFVKLGAAGFAAVAGVILIVSSVGAHQAHSTARGGLLPFSRIASSTTQSGSDLEKDVAAVETDAQADAAAQAAEAQQDAAELAAAQAAAAAEAQQDAAEEAAEAQAEAAEEAAEAQAEAAEPPETNDEQSGDKTNETGDHQTEHSDSGTSGSHD